MIDENDIYAVIGEDGFARLVAAFYAQVPDDDIRFARSSTTRRRS